MGQSLTAAGLGTRVPLHTALPGPGHFRRQRDHRAVYACERACSCVQRAGYRYADGGVHLRCIAARPEAIYEQQRQPHIMGNTMPVALLRASSFGATPVRRAGPAPPATFVLRRQSDLLGHPRCV